MNNQFMQHHQQKIITEANCASDRAIAEHVCLQFRDLSHLLGWSDRDEGRKWERTVTKPHFNYSAS